MSALKLEVPQEPLFTELLRLHQENPQKTLIREVADSTTEHSIHDFLYDVLSVRGKLYQALSPAAQRQLSNSGDDVFICVLAPPGYRFVVLLFAIYALGAVVCPLSPRILPGEAEYYLKLSKCALLVTVEELQTLSNDIAAVSHAPQYVYASPGPPPQGLDIVPTSEYHPIDPTRGFLLIFTSGTTGAPKGVLHTRSSVENGLQRQISEFGLTHSDTWLHHEPVHWVFGPVSAMAVISASACIEFCREVFDDEWLLKRMQGGDATCVHIAPSGLTSLAEKLKSVEDEWDAEEYEATVRGLREGLRWFCTGAMKVNPADLALWKEIRGGKVIIVAYGTTETLGINISTRNHAVPMGCCGIARPDVQIKISDEGEVCLRTTSMFKSYITSTPHDPTSEAFDSEGFYKTGDLGHLDGDLLFITGRGKDIIRFHGWKLATADVEHTILEHPHIREAVVFGLPDPEAGERVAALVRLDSSYPRSSRGTFLSELRQWLRKHTKLPVYKYPTTLRILTEDEKVPRTASEKVQKDRVREMYFEQSHVAAGVVELAGLDGEDVEAREWDWAGNA